MLIKSLKKAISFAIGGWILSSLEFQTVCFEAANLVNKRPIGCHPTNPGDSTYLSPNHHILQHPTTTIPAGPFKEPINLKHHFEFVEKLLILLGVSGQGLLPKLANSSKMAHRET